MRSTEARRLVEAAKREAPSPALEGAILGALGVAAVASAAPSLATKLWIALKHAAASKVSLSVVAVAAMSGSYEAGRQIERATYVHEQPPAPALARAEPRPPTPALTPTLTPAPTLAPTETKTTPTTKSEPTTFAATTTATETATPTVTAKVTATATATATAAATATATATPTASLADEISSVQRARSRLLSGDGRDALQTLDAYDARYPNGELREEALALRVRAARLAGDDAAAKSALDRLKTQFPKSVQLRALQNAP